MKKIIFFLLFVIAGIEVAVAQNYQEVLYLKDGSVIRGVIIEQIPNKSVKIQTSDGSIYVYESSNVEKITKESNSYSKSVRRDKTKNVLLPQGNDLDIIKYECATKPIYKGYLDLGYAIGVGKYTRDRFFISLSNGVQIVPHFYVGVGLGLNIYTRPKNRNSQIDELLNYNISKDFKFTRIIGAPLFLDLRTTFLKKKNSPFLEFRVGYTFGMMRGVYALPIFGARFEIENKIGTFVGFGYEYQGSTLRKESLFISDPDGNIIAESFSVVSSYNCGGLRLSFGIDF